MNKNKELLNKSNQNLIRLTVLQKQAQKYRDFLKSIKNLENKIEKESNKLNFYFTKPQEKEKNEFESKTNEEKPLFISKKIEDLKIVSSKIKDKVTDFQISKLPKDELFKELEKQIAEFEAMIEQLKEENKLLKKELELLIEQEQKESQKVKLEKENSSLKEKIEALKIKDKTPLKINKITYSQVQEQER